MYRYAEAAKYKCKPCRNSISVDDLEAVFSDTLKGFFFSEKDINKYIEESSDDIAKKQKLVTHQSTALSKLKIEMDKIYDLYIQDMISPAAFKERYSPLETRKDQIETDLPRLQAELDALKINLRSKDQMIVEAQSLYSRWSTLSFQQKREIVESITESVIINKTDVEINLHYVPQNNSNPNMPQTSNTHPSKSSGKKATNNHGFMAAISWNRAG